MKMLKTYVRDNGQLKTGLRNYFSDTVQLETLCKKTPEKVGQRESRPGGNRKFPC